MIPGLIGSFIRAHKVLSKNLNSAFNSKQMLDAFLQSKNYKVKRNLILSPRARVSDRKALIAEYPSIVQENLLGILNVPIISKKTPDITDYLKNPRKDSMSVYPSYRPLSDSVFMTSVVNDIQGHYLMLPSRIEVRKMAKGLASPSEKWVDSLLLRTPIMFVVVQTNRLFSDASLNQMNPPYIKLQNAITNLNRETPTGGGRGKARAMYNMHDIVPIKKFNQVLGGGGDALVKEIIKHSKVEITDSNFIPVGGQPVGLDVTSSSTRDDLLYDLKYTSFKLLTIEKDGDQSHEKFLNLLESFKGISSLWV